MYVEPVSIRRNDFCHYGKLPHLKNILISHSLSLPALMKHLAIDSAGLLIGDMFVCNHQTSQFYSLGGAHTVQCYCFRTCALKRLSISTPKKKRRNLCCLGQREKLKILWKYLWDVKTISLHPPPTPAPLFVFWVILLSFNLLNQSFPVASRFGF